MITSPERAFESTTWLFALIAGGVFAATILLTGSSLFLLGPLLILFLLLVGLHAPLALIAVSIFTGGIHLAIFTQGKTFLTHWGEGFDLNAFRLAGVVIGGGLTIVLRKYFLKIPEAKAILKPYLLFLLYGLFTLSYSDLPFDGVRLILKLIYPLIIFMLVVALGTDSTEVTERMKKYLLTALWVLGIATFIVYVFNSDFNSRIEMVKGDHGGVTRFSGFSGDTTNGILMAFCALVFYSKFCQTLKISYLLPIGLFIFFTLISYSRTSLGSLFIGMTAISILSRKKMLTVASLILPLIIIAFSTPLKSRLLYSGTTETREILTLDAISHVHFSAREIFWASALNSVRQHPILGIGLGSLAPFIGADLESQGMTEVRSLVHNEYLRLLAETGIIGLLLWLFTYFRMFKLCFSSLRQAEARDKWVPITAIGSLILYLLYCFFDNGLDYYTYIAQYVWVMVAFALLTLRTGAGKKETVSNHV